MARLTSVVNLTDQNLSLIHTYSGPSNFDVAPYSLSERDGAFQLPSYYTKAH
ncbi:MAG: hypothetical protein ACPGGK_08060 [Pikeienuella sp.]